MSVDELFDRVATRLLDEGGVEEGRMLHNMGLRVAGGKYFAFVARGDIVVKLPAARVAELVASGEGRPCEIGSRGPMREWVRLRPPDEAACMAYLSEARSFVESQSLVRG